MTTVDWGEPRTRTATWHDPRIVAEASQRLSGREHLQAIAARVLPAPPIAELFGFELIEVGDGEVRFTVTPDESTYNPIGAVHGGLACTLLDSVCGCAGQTLLPAGTGYTSLEIKVSYTRPITAASGLLTAHGWVAKPGRRVLFTEGDVRDGDGRVLATASSTLLVVTP